MYALVDYCADLNFKPWPVRGMSIADDEIGSDCGGRECEIQE